MQDSWFDLVNRVLRPARQHLAFCLGERELHVTRERLVAKARVSAMVDCERRIDEARRMVFAANDGVISSHMTDLEREWRRISRSDPEGGLMELWARVAPSAWLDRKRWRDSDPAAKVDAALALAADTEGVEAAESAVSAFRVALAAWGVQVGPRIRWRSFDADTDCVSDVLRDPHRLAHEAVTLHDAGAVILERAAQLERAVHGAALVRFPARPLLVQGLSRAALLDFLLRAVSLEGRPNPMTSLRALWQTGYALSAVDTAGVTLEIPDLP